LAVRYVLAGLLGDEYAQLLHRCVQQQPDPTAFILLPALRGDSVRSLFCAADLGFWPRVAITIQQAMGTGLPMALRRRPSVSHLLIPGENGWYLDVEGALADCLAGPVAQLGGQSNNERLERRQRIASLNESYLSYDVIAGAMVDGL
jgi:hypothetical protein